MLEGLLQILAKRSLSHDGMKIYKCFTVVNVLSRHELISYKNDEKFKRNQEIAVKQRKEKNERRKEH